MSTGVIATAIDGGYKEARVTWKPISDKTLLHIETSSQNRVLYWFFSELLDELSRPQNIAVSEMEFCEVLRKHGFKNMSDPTGNLTRNRTNY